MYSHGVSTPYDGLAANPSTAAYQIGTAQRNAIAWYMPETAQPSYAQLAASGLFASGTGWRSGTTQPTQVSQPAEPAVILKTPQGGGWRHVNPLTGNDLTISDASPTSPFSRRMARLERAISESRPN